VIGVCVGVSEARFGPWEAAAVVAHAAYSESIIRAGALCVMIPPHPTTPGFVEQVLGSVDGLVFTGGVDVDPGRYGDSIHPRTDPVDSRRDSWEMALVLGAINLRVPVLAICRGMQMLNVALGGSLRQHLDDVQGHAVHGGSGRFTATTVTTKTGSAVADAVGSSAVVRCHHHQAVDCLASELVPTAWDGNGLVEAVEVAGRPAMGVQWHPESDPSGRPLFDLLVRRATDIRGSVRSGSGHVAPPDRGTGADWSGSPILHDHEETLPTW